MATATTPAPDDAIRVYWQTGCTACLRTKEFLTRHGIPFISRDVGADEKALDELERFGLRQIPIVTRGDKWANGQVLADVARIAGIPWGPQKIFPVAELQRRQDIILTAALRHAAQLPEETLSRQLPDRPRSYAELVHHLFNIADAFLEHDRGIRLVYESYDRVPPPEMKTKEDLLAYGREILAGTRKYFAERAAKVDWNARANVYYGEQTLHEYYERTTWHSGQHGRQLMFVLNDLLGIKPDQPLGKEVFEGLPMPEQVWG